MRFFPHYVVIGFSNSYLLAPDTGNDAVIIDPGRFDGEILTLIEKNKLNVRKVLVTNTHESHVTGIRTLLRIYDAEVYCYRNNFMGIKAKPVRDGQIITCGELSFTVIETPGHSRDSVTYRLGDWLFTGDTLTAGLTGTTPYNQAHMLQLVSIRKKLLPLGDDLVIFPGHGPPTRLGLERRFNVMLNESCPRARSSGSIF